MLTLATAIVFSLAISMIWVYYLRAVDLFERETTSHIVLVFILGALSPFLVDLLSTFVLEPLQIKQNGNWMHDFSYFVLGVGLPEELAKLLPAWLVIHFIKKARNEPLDYIVFACVSALGFAFHENILYIRLYDLSVLTSRSVLSVPAHMFFSAICMYGFVVSRFNNTKLGKTNILLFFLLAILSHGFYDFWLSLEASASVLITILYFFLTISVFITILNNCMNNSPFYTPRKIIDSEKLCRNLSLQYFILLVAIVLAVGLVIDYPAAVALALYTIVFRVLILGILVIRLSRFKIIPGRWNPIKAEMPFTVMLATNSAGGQAMVGGPLLRIRVKGESFNEVHLNAFLEEHLELLPVSARRTTLGQRRVAVMEKKLFLKDDETFYLMKVILTLEPEKSVFYLLKAKTRGASRTPQGYPIAALLKIKDPLKLADQGSSLEDFPFLEWVILRPLKN